MLGFWHTTLLVGPQRRIQLDTSQCLDCDWIVTGNKSAIAIAERGTYLREAAPPHGSAITRYSGFVNRLNA
jgi:hypothetical protein